MASTRTAGFRERWIFVAWRCEHERRNRALAIFHAACPYHLRARANLWRKVAQWEAAVAATSGERPDVGRLRLRSIESRRSLGVSKHRSSKPGQLSSSRRHRFASLGRSDLWAALVRHFVKAGLPASALLASLCWPHAQMTPALFLAAAKALI